MMMMDMMVRVFAYVIGSLFARYDRFAGDRGIPSGRESCECHAIHAPREDVSDYPPSSNASVAHGKRGAGGFIVRSLVILAVSLIAVSTAAAKPALAEARPPAVRSNARTPAHRQGNALGLALASWWTT